MSDDIFPVLRDVIVLGYMFFLRIGLPLLCIVLIGKWIQVKMTQVDRREQIARQGEPYCWQSENTPQTRRAQAAAEKYPDLPCWLAVQHAGGGVTEDCVQCPRYAVPGKRTRSHRVEAGSYE